MTVYNAGSSTIPSYVEVETNSKIAQSVSVRRGSSAYAGIFISKIIVIGSLCDSVDTPLDSSYSSISSWTVSYLTSEATVIGVPSYYRCSADLDSYDIEDIEITLRDGSEFESTAEVVSVDEWATYYIDVDTGLG